MFFENLTLRYKPNPPALSHSFCMSAPYFLILIEFEWGRPVQAYFKSNILYESQMDIKFTANFLSIDRPCDLWKPPLRNIHFCPVMFNFEWCRPAFQVFRLLYQDPLWHVHFCSTSNAINTPLCELAFSKLNEPDRAKYWPTNFLFLCKLLKPINLNNCQSVLNVIKYTKNALVLL